jgi:hypothetical protein
VVKTRYCTVAVNEINQFSSKVLVGPASESSLQGSLVHRTGVGTVPVLGDIFPRAGRVLFSHEMPVFHIPVPKLLCLVLFF